MYPNESDARAAERDFRTAFNAMQKDETLPKNPRDLTVGYINQLPGFGTCFASVPGEQTKIVIVRTNDNHEAIGKVLTTLGAKPAMRLTL